MAAVVLLELALHPIVAAWNDPATNIRTIRAYSEGISDSHFLISEFGTYGHRLTGNPFVAGAPTGVIIGDSHVVQGGVSDSETMGADLERISRTAGHPVNIKQYGWYDAAAPTYIANAAAVLKKEQPAWVVVVLNGTDMSEEATETGWYWRMRIAPNYSFQLIDARSDEPSAKHSALQEFLAQSSLLLAVRRRANLILPNVLSSSTASASVRDPEQVKRVPRASVRGLKNAYGSRLLMVYTPWCGDTCTDQPDRDEAAFLDACRQEGARCVTARPEMAAGLRAGFISRGFHNTGPGVGHLNPDGLEMTAQAMWRGLHSPNPVD